MIIRGSLNDDICIIRIKKRYENDDKNKEKK